MTIKRRSSSTKTKARRRKSASASLKLKIVIHEAEEGGYWAEVPGFSGCVSEGETLEEVRANIREAFEGLLEVMQDAPTEEAGRVQEIDL